MSSASQNLPDDPAFLKAMIAALQAENAKMSATLQAHDQLIQTLRLRIAKLKKQVFGKSSEKIEREIQQLELAMIEPPECKNYFANAGYAAIKTWKPLNRKHRTDRSHLAKEYRSTRR